MARRLTDDERRQNQYDVYRDFLEHVEDHLHDSGSNELTLADFNDTDKTANYVVCPVLYIVKLDLDGFMDTIRGFPAYDGSSIEKNASGQLVVYVRIAWNLVKERRHSHHHSAPFRHTKNRSGPPPMWQGVVAVFGILVSTLFAVGKGPLLGWE